VPLGTGGGVLSTIAVRLVRLVRSGGPGFVPFLFPGFMPLRRRLRWGKLPSALRRSAESGGVDDEAVADVLCQDPLVRFVDLVGSDDLDLGAELALGAEVEHLLGLADPSDRGAGEGAATEDQREHVDGQRVGRGPPYSQSTGDSHSKEGPTQLSGRGGDA
jgi:hypothetical protein